MSKVLIAPWGWPYNWNCAYYAFNGIKTSKPVKTSLNILLKSINPEKSFIIIPASSLKNLDELPENYFNLETRVRFEIEKLIKQPEYIGFNENMEIIVVPTVGEYKVGNKKLIFKGSFNNAYIIALWEIGKRLQELTELNFIAVDTTHGINIFPIYVSKLCENLAKGFSIRKVIDIMLLNSEPYPTGVKKLDCNSEDDVPILTVHVCDQVKYKKSFYEKLFSLSSIPDDWLFNHPRFIADKSLNQKIRSKYPNYNKLFLNSLAFLISLAKGFPLGVLHFKPASSKLYKLIDYVIELMKKETVIEINENIYIIFPTLTKLLEPLIFAYIFAKEIEDLGFEYNPEQGITLRNLVKFAQIIYRDTPFNHLISTELRVEGDLWKIIQSLPKKSDWQKVEGTKEARVFIAHVGLAQYYLDFKKESDDINNTYIKYGNRLNAEALIKMFKSELG